MIPARIVGTTTSTIKHPSMNGCRLVLCEGLDEHGEGQGDFFIAADYLGAGHGTQVCIASDGDLAEIHHGDHHSPIRDTVIGLIDRMENIDA